MSRLLSAARLAVVPAALGVLIWAKTRGHREASRPTVHAIHHVAGPANLRTSTAKIVEHAPEPTGVPVPEPTPVVPAVEPAPNPAGPVAEAHHAPDRPVPTVPEDALLVADPVKPAEPVRPTVTIGEKGSYMVRVKINGQGAVFFPSFEAAGEYPVEVRAEKRP